jgi:molybdenum cofactor cytidylyltransferase
MNIQEGNMTQIVETNVGAVVLAAGLSQRMGEPKVLMPWGNSTVIRTIVETLLSAGVVDVIVVAGKYYSEIDSSVEGLPIKLVFNPQYENGEMIDSLKIGLKNLSPKTEGTLIVLGDQPFIQQNVVRISMQTFQENDERIVIPTYKMRRGHPLLIPRSLGEQLIELDSGKTLRDFTQAHLEDIFYVIVDTPTILFDLDTPEDYENYRHYEK